MWGMSSLIRWGTNILYSFWVIEDWLVRKWKGMNKELYAGQAQGHMKTLERMIFERIVVLLFKFL